MSSSLFHLYSIVQLLFAPRFPVDSRAVLVQNISLMQSEASAKDRHLTL